MIVKTGLATFCFFLHIISQAQFLSYHRFVPVSSSVGFIFPENATVENDFSSFEMFKIRKHTFGTILGIQKGEMTNLVFGGEFHWKKFKLIHPRLWAANFSIEYNFASNVAGYRAGFFYKIGRVALTYGASACYITDFQKGKIGITPSIGFRLIGLHLTTGYNVFVNNDPVKKYNTFHVGVVYYFPVFSDTDVVRSHKKKNKEGFFKRLFNKED